MSFTCIICPVESSLLPARDGLPQEQPSSFLKQGLWKMDPHKRHLIASSSCCYEKWRAMLSTDSFMLNGCSFKFQTWKGKMKDEGSSQDCRAAHGTPASQHTRHCWVMCSKILLEMVSTTTGRAATREDFWMKLLQEEILKNSITMKNTKNEMFTFKQNYICQFCTELEYGWKWVWVYKNMLTCFKECNCIMFVLFTPTVSLTFNMFAIEKVSFIKDDIFKINWSKTKC